MLTVDLKKNNFNFFLSKTHFLFFYFILQGTKFGYYAAIYNKNNAESKLDQSIQSCKQVERDPDATEESEGKEFIILFF